MLLLAPRVSVQPRSLVLSDLPRTTQFTWSSGTESVSGLDSTHKYQVAFVGRSCSCQMATVLRLPELVLEDNDESAHMLLLEDNDEHTLELKEAVDTTLEDNVEASDGAPESDVSDSTDSDSDESSGNVAAQDATSSNPDSAAVGGAKRRVRCPTEIAAAAPLAMRKAAQQMMSADALAALEELGHVALSTTSSPQLASEALRFYHSGHCRGGHSGRGRGSRLLSPTLGLHTHTPPSDEPYPQQ